MKEMHKQRDFSTPFIHSLIKTWLLGDDEQKKDLEKVFMFLTDPQNEVTEKEYYKNK
tara:strand:+ start:757 stop:927 length:171 start_codon:yes stop_codon:yes gene_type:complete